MKAALSISEIATCKAIHCPNAFSVSIAFSEPEFKISYSGDTRPNAQFAQIGFLSDVLIHEATMEDDLLAEAIKKKHSTFAEALSIADQMCASNVILTHFSQRYPKISGMMAGNSENQEINEGIHGGYRNIAMAFDGMIMPVSQIALQKDWFDVLGKVYRDLPPEEGDMDEEDDVDLQPGRAKARGKSKRQREQSQQQQQHQHSETEHSGKRARAYQSVHI